MPYGAAPNVHKAADCPAKVEKKQPEPSVSAVDRRSHAEALTVSFISMYV